MSKIPRNEKPLTEEERAKLPGKGNCSKAGKFAFSYDYCMGSVRDYWLCPGRPGRNEPWKICR